MTARFGLCGLPAAGATPTSALGRGLGRVLAGSSFLLPSFLPVEPVQAQGDVERWRLTSEPVFSSADYPQAPFSVVGRLDDGYMLTPTKFVVADGLAEAMHFVDVGDGSSSTVAASRLGVPPAALPIQFTDRSGSRVVVPDREGRPFLYVLSADGQFVDSMSYDWPARSYDWPARVVGVFEDGTLVTRGGSGLADRYNQPPVQWFLYPAEVARPIAEAVLGPTAWVTAKNGSNSVSSAVRLIFGHRVLAVRSGDRLVVNQTDLNTIRAYDRDGSPAFAFVLPTRRTRPTRRLVDAQRERRIASEPNNSHVYASAMAAMGRNFTPFNADSIQVMQVPAADSTPHSDRLLADGSGRVWVREFLMPDDPLQRWHVWQLDDGERRKLVTMPRDERLLDAYGKICLLFVVDQAGSGRVVLREMELAENGNSQGDATRKAMEEASPPSAQVRTLGVGDDVIYDSGDSAGGAQLEIGALSGGVILPDGRLVIGDRTELYWVDHEAGQVRVLGGAGRGPGEFGHVGELLRTPDGVAAWDLGARRLTSYSQSGELLWSRSYDPTAFRHWMAPPVAVFRDGAVLFRDGVDSFETTGILWDSARYVVVRDGDHEPFATASGNEMYAHRFGAADVATTEFALFGDRTYEAATANGMVVVETARSAVTVFDETGAATEKLGLPSKVAVSREEIEVAREEMASRSRRRYELAGRVMAPRGIAGPGARDVAEALMEVPANPHAPAVDQVLVDADGRLWLRLHRRRLEAEVVRWQVRDVERDRTLFVVEQRDGARVWDARGDLVLTSVEDDLGVPRVRLRRLASAQEAR